MTIPPNFGKDLEPTDDMIARGRFGNGAYGNDEKTLEVVRAEKRRLAIQRKEDRRAEYENQVVESLGDIADFQDSLIQLGKKVVKDALAKGADELSKAELDIVGKALKASDQVANRVLGLASRLDDKAVHVDALSYLIEGQEVSVRSDVDKDDNFDITNNQIEVGIDE